MSGCCHAIVELKVNLQDAIVGNNLQHTLISHCLTQKSHQSQSRKSIK